MQERVERVISEEELKRKEIQSELHKFQALNEALKERMINLDTDNNALRELSNTLS